MKLLKRGALFAGIDPCVDEDADPHSDVARFGPGVKWAYAADDWALVS